MSGSPATHKPIDATRRALANPRMLSERRTGFLYGLAAGALLWEGIDGAFARGVARHLPSGMLGDFLALLLLLLWGGAVAVLAWRGFVRAGTTRRRPRARRKAETSKARS